MQKSTSGIGARTGIFFSLLRTFLHNNRMDVYFHLSYNKPGINQITKSTYIPKKKINRHQLKPKRKDRKNM